MQAAIKNHKSHLAPITTTSTTIMAFDHKGRTALYMACSCGATEIALKLIKGGSNCNAQDQDQCTPLFVAATNGYSNCVHLLLRAGAFLDLPDSNGITPLMAAAREGHLQCTKALVESGASQVAVDFHLKRSAYSWVHRTSLLFPTCTHCTPERIYFWSLIRRFLA